MLNETKLKAGLVIAILILLWEAVMWNNDLITVQTQKQTINNLIHENDSLSIKYDSLREEHFIISVNNGRYEVTLEHLKEINPKAGKQFEDFLQNETE